MIHPTKNVHFGASDDQTIRTFFEASEVAEAAVVYEAAEVSKALKITTDQHTRADLEFSNDFGFFLDFFLTES